MKEYVVRVYYDRKEWYLNGKLHREDGPAVECADGSKEWRNLDGELHREDGPALEWFNGDKEWWINDIELSEKEFNQRTKTKKLTVSEISELLGYDVEIKTSIINKSSCLLNYKYCLCNMKNKKRILQEKEGVLFPKSFGISSKLKDDNFTGFYDDNNQPIFVGDKLKSEWGYEVIVVKDNGYSGKLVCDDKHSCKNIPYDLSRGKGYTK